MLDYPAALEQYVIEESEHYLDERGYHIRFRFPNNYGASIIQTWFSYGGAVFIEQDDRLDIAGYTNLYELAVLVFEGDKCSLTYNTPITDNVLGSLTDSDVCNLLYEIYNLSDPL